MLGSTLFLNSVHGASGKRTTGCNGMCLLVSESLYRRDYCYRDDEEIDHRYGDEMCGWDGKTKRDQCKLIIKESGWARADG